MLLWSLKNQKQVCIDRMMRVQWSHLSANQDLTARSWYYMEVFADPLNENVVYVLNAPMMRSIDGGKTWSNIRVGHGDTHDLWINPQQTSNLILGDDGEQRSVSIPARVGVPSTINLRHNFTG